MSDVSTGTPEATIEAVRLPARAHTVFAGTSGGNGTGPAIVENESGAIERDHAAQGARDRLEERLPVEAAHDRVVHPQQDPPPFLKIFAEATQFVREAPRPDLGHHGGRQAAKDFDLVFFPHTRPRIHDAESAQGESVGRGQGHARVGDDAQLRDPQVVLDERVLSGVRDHERLARRDRVLAERVRQGRLSHRGPRLGQSHRALEELPLVVHERNHRGGHVQDAGGQTRQPVERLFGRRIEQRGSPEGIQASGVLELVVALVFHEITSPKDEAHPL
jgi:hypothetical protein